MPLSPKAQKEFEFYAQFHQNDTNETIHKIAVPIIAATSLAFFAYFPVTVAAPGFNGANPTPLLDLPLLGVLNFGHLAFLGAMAYYLRMDFKLGLSMAVYGLALPLARVIHWELALFVFVVAWIFQFIGHGVFEKRSPAFTSTPHQLLIGPFYIHALFLGHKIEPKLPSAESNGAQPQEEPSTASA